MTGGIPWSIPSPSVHYNTRTKITECPFRSNDFFCLECTFPKIISTQNLTRWQYKLPVPDAWLDLPLATNMPVKRGLAQNAKKEIVVPDKSQEVVIHAPETEGPKDSKGVSVLKPIKREELKVTGLQIGIAVAIALVSIGVALGVRFATDSPPVLVLALGAAALAFPLSWVGYRFLRDDELGGYMGNELYVRVAACAGVFCGLMGALLVPGLLFWQRDIVHRQRAFLRGIAARNDCGRDCWLAAVSRTRIRSKSVALCSVLGSNASTGDIVRSRTRRTSLQW